MNVFMNKKIVAAAGLLVLLSSCNMENPLLNESPLPYGAPQFDLIKDSHYLPAFKQGIKEAKAEVDAIVANAEAPTFANTIEAMEFSGKTLNRVANIFYNLKEANTNPEMEKIAEEVSPLMTDLEMYISLNPKLFARVKAVYDEKDSLGLEKDQMRLLEKTYKGFVKNGALLSDEDKAEYSKINEKLSLLTLKFSKNALDATNAYKMNLTDSSELAGLPQYVIDMGAATAKENGQQGWTYDLTRPSMAPFMKFSSRRDLRQRLYMASSTKAVGGEFDNTEICREIIALRIKMANMLGYDTYADYQVEDRMVGSVANVFAFMKELMDPSLPAARREVAQIYEFAKKNGFEDSCIRDWDFSFWSEKYKQTYYNLSEEEIKPYFQLDSTISAVLNLATRLYGVKFVERKDIPGYHPDVKVFDVFDGDGKHLSLFYADFFPRASKRGGAWMTDFRGQSIENGVENRPFVSIVTNFSKPTAEAPSLLTHDELTTFLHEFGHALHGMLAEGRYRSLTGTNVDHDFVELPSQIMENWAFEREYLKTFAKHYLTGEPISDELINKIIATQNYCAAYAQVRQLQFGTIDMSWHTLKALPEEGTVEFEKKVLEPFRTFPYTEGTCMSPTFSHIFAGGYSAGYYSYKWAEVLEADAFSLFQEKGIFNREVSGSFRENILSKGSSEKESVLYRKFRGHDPEPKALLVKLGIISK